MKANITNLKKVLRICAKAHKCKLHDWSSEGQLGVGSTNIPTVSDVYTILDAFFGDHGAAETGWGYITIWLDESMYRSKREVDVDTLALALPYGTQL